VASCDKKRRPEEGARTKTQEQNNPYGGFIAGGLLFTGLFSLVKRICFY
jgi:hypothetical protein